MTSRFILRTHRASAVTFLMGSPTLDPTEVTAALGITPTNVAVPGSTLETWDGSVVHVDRVGWWSLSSADHVASSDVDAHFRFLLEQLLPHRENVLGFAKGGETLFEVPLPPDRAAELGEKCAEGAAALGATIEFLGER